jgi:hypothetical protein
MFYNIKIKYVFLFKGMKVVMNGICLKAQVVSD